VHGYRWPHVPAVVSFVATFAKPSTNFINSLPCLFGLPSVPWLKTDAGLRDGENQNVEASNGVIHPHVALLPVEGNRRIKNLRPAEVQEPGHD
jgi:hypothetical protein